MQTGERQTARLRLKYLQAVLKKDINFFDNEARDANIIFHISSDAILVQDAIGDKVCNIVKEDVLFKIVKASLGDGYLVDEMILSIELNADRPCHSLPFSIHCWICHWIYLGVAAHTTHLGCGSINSCSWGSLYNNYVYFIRKGRSSLC